MMAAVLSSDAHSCRCAWRPVTDLDRLQAFCAADLVFSGVVLGEKSIESDPRDKTYTFRVDAPYRGDTEQFMSTSPNWHSCTKRLTRGDRYLVYAKRDSESGLLDVRKCSFTVQIDESDEPLVLWHENAAREQATLCKQDFYELRLEDETKKFLERYKKLLEDTEALLADDAA
ncbi:MAG: hypothetical protein AAFY15_01935 [Cyanobacteria bacterium J06648_11]